ncbi:hypothetical protein GCM10011415_34740 [Salipiger pallidus]|uniref:Uncharacterized protein n=1 Tax=Salipiger pallidus TaxID=1775170 RepID=A0A8J2ZMF6_9RHOB|nr:hypothetical protein GCM10011415_34740 [Salipiger pallidus]
MLWGAMPVSGKMTAHPRLSCGKQFPSETPATQITVSMRKILALPAADWARNSLVRPRRRGDGAEGAETAPPPAFPRRTLQRDTVGVRSCYGAIMRHHGSLMHETPI